MAKILPGYSFFEALNLFKSPGRWMIGNYLVRAGLLIRRSFCVGFVHDKYLEWLADLPHDVEKYRRAAVGARH